MIKLFNGWRYYGFTREDYFKSIGKVVLSNLFSLWIVSLWAAIFYFVFGVVFMYRQSGMPQRNDWVLYFIMSAVCTAFSFYHYRLHRKAEKGLKISHLAVCFKIILLYSVVIFGAIHIGILLGDGAPFSILVGVFVCINIAIVAMPWFNLAIILSSAVLFSVLSMATKSYEFWLQNVLSLSAVVPATIVFNWLVNVYKMRAVNNERALAEERDKFQQESTVDELTGLRNRRDFDATFNRFLNNRRCTDTGRFACLALLDIDHFKEYNDHYGHAAGDECLKKIGEALGDLRDTVGVYTARVGGEEFALLWFEEDSVRMQNVVAEAQWRIGRLEIPHEKSPVSDNVTVSIGVYAIPCDSLLDTETIYNMTDRALYDAKDMGRNCAILYDAGNKYHMPAMASQ
ncbi:MAG: diguanylate cyclase [Defluviitaleaceae bacterium]|nr:diguanylate cyclase [Defluviitaleaceae bacterium]